MKRIVTIGGGHGQPALLRYLKQYPYELTALVSPMDNGGSGGALREQYGILPLGDPRHCLLALSEHEDEYAAWWEYRFQEGALKGHTVGNIVLAGMLMQKKTLDPAHRLLQVKGRVISMSDQPGELVAYLQNGDVITGETHIDRADYDINQRIERISLSQPIPISDAARAAIQFAELIVLTMGDLYTSILPNLLVSGVPEAIQASGAPVVMICNRSTKPGETQHYSSRTFLSEMNRYLAPAAVSVVVMDDGSIAVPPPSEAVTLEALEDVRVVQTDLADEQNLSCVSGKKAAEVIHTLCASF